MKRNILLFFLLTHLLTYKQTQAQYDFTLYNMEHVQQRNQLNPAFIPQEGKFFLGIPVLSSIYFNAANSGFKYSDVIKHRADDSLYVDFPSLLSKLATNNYINLNFKTDLLAVGMAFQNNYLSLTITERANMTFNYQKNFLEFFWKGNGAFLDKEVDFKFGLNATHYREYALGYSRKVTEKFSTGIKLKYLYGMENLSLKKTNISIFTDSKDYSITAKGNIEINSSGLGKDTLSNGAGSYAFGRKNNGFGIDMGVEYKATDKISFSASLLDLGFIKWKYNNNNYVNHNSNAQFTYTGFDLNEFIYNDSMNTKDIGKNLTDSLSKIFKIDTLHQTYKTSLTTQFYLGMNNQITPSGNIGLLIYGQVIDKHIKPGISLSYNHKVGQLLNLSASYSIHNRSYTNLGVGAAVAGGPFQFYIVTDNLIGMIVPHNTKNLHFRFGINFRLGSSKKGNSGSDTSTSSAPPAPEPASSGGK